MTENPPDEGIDPAALQIFMKRVRTTLGNDLRTSLGTIVNYASVLDDEEIRDLPRRIRVEAMQSADMLQLLLDATLLAASLPAFTSIDPAVLLQSVVAEIKGDVHASETACAPADGRSLIRLESDVVRFVWRTFLRLEDEQASRPLSGARATVDRHADHVRIGLSFPTNGNPGPRLDGVDAARGAEVAVSAGLCPGLRLSGDLVAARGGELEVRGHIGTDAELFLRFGSAS